MSDSTEVIVRPGGHRTPGRRRRGAGAAGPLPVIVSAAGGGAEFAWDEFFNGQIANAHTRKIYAHAVRHFLDWCDHPDRRFLSSGSPLATSVSTWRAWSWQPRPRSSAWPPRGRSSTCSSCATSSS